MPGRGGTQLGFDWDTPPDAPDATLKIAAELCHAVSRALKESPLDRYRVAAEMSRLTGDDITKTRLDSWSAEGKERNRFPAEYLPAFIVAAGAPWLLARIADRCGLRLVGEDELRHLEAGRLHAEIRNLEARKDELLTEVGLIEGGAP